MVHHHQGDQLRSHHLEAGFQYLRHAALVRLFVMLYSQPASKVLALSLQCQVDLQHHPNLFGWVQSQNLYLLISRPRLAWKVLQDDFVIVEVVPLRKPHQANLQDSPRGHCFLSCFSVFCWCRNRSGPRTKQRSQNHAGVIKTAIFQYRR